MTYQADDRPSRDDVPRKRLDARVRNYRNRTLVAGPGDPFELTDSAAAVWKMIDGNRSVGDLADALCAEYDIDRETAMADVAEFVATLTHAGILTD